MYLLGLIFLLIIYVIVLFIPIVRWIVGVPLTFLVIAGIVVLFQDHKWPHVSLNVVIIPLVVIAVGFACWVGYQIFVTTVESQRIKKQCALDEQKRIEAQRTENPDG